VDANAVFETFVFGGMRALMTNIQHVDIWAEAEAIFDPISDAEPITRRHAGVRHIAMRPRVAARSAMSGASWPATEAGECGHETPIAIPTSGGTPSTRVRVPGRVVRCRRSGLDLGRRQGGYEQRERSFRHHEWPPTARGPRRSIRFARLERERMTAFHTAALVATRCAAPSVAVRSSMSGASLPATKAS